MRVPKQPLGSVVLSMAGMLQTGKHDYFHVKQILKDWNEHKLYWATKKNYKVFNKALKGVKASTAERVECWLERGYAIEKEFKYLVVSLEHSACH